MEAEQRLTTARTARVGFRFFFCFVVKVEPEPYSTVHGWDECLMCDGERVIKIL